MIVTKRILKDYFSSVNRDDQKETSIKINGSFNTYLVGRNGALCRHYYLRQRLMISTTKEQISITHATWEEGNLPNIKEFTEMLFICNSCYIAARNGIDPRNVKDKIQSLFSEISNKRFRIPFINEVIVSVSNTNAGTDLIARVNANHEATSKICEAAQISNRCKLSTDTVNTFCSDMAGTVINRGGNISQWSLSYSYAKDPNSVIDSDFSLKKRSLSPLVSKSEKDSCISAEKSYNRPCFSLPYYPVNSFTLETSRNLNRDNFSNETAYSKILKNYSNQHLEDCHYETQINSKTPPTNLRDVHNTAASGLKFGLRSNSHSFLSTNQGSETKLSSDSVSRSRSESRSETAQQELTAVGKNNYNNHSKKEIAQVNSDLPLSLERFCNEYFSHKIFKHKTMIFYTKIIKKHIAPHYDKFQNIENITVLRIAELIIKPIIKCNKISTAYNIRNTLIAIINHAMIVHDLGSCPQLRNFSTLSLIAGLPPKSDFEKSYAAMINGDIGKNIGFIFKTFHERVKNRKMKALLELSFHLCLRQSEIINIRKSNIDFTGHRLHIVETKTISAKKGGFDIPLNSHTEALLRHVINIETPVDQQTAKYEKDDGKDTASLVSECSYKENQRDYLFISDRSGGKISSNALGVYFNRIKELKGKQTAHGIRAIFKTWAHRNKIDDITSECVLSHRCWSKVAISYNRDLATYLYTDRQELMKKWSDFLCECIGKNSVLKS
jgi:hypothetical protein